MKRAPWTLAGLASLACLLGSPVEAVDMHVTPTDIHQENLGAGFTVGHWIDASASMPNLTVSGGFVVSCSEPVIPEIRESYSATQTVVLGPNVLSKGIPEPLPAHRSLSNWNKIKTGTVLPCNYQLQAKAVESAITIGSGGSSIVIGGGEKSENYGIPFDMVKIGVYLGPGCLD